MREGFDSKADWRAVRSLEARARSSVRELDESDSGDVASCRLRGTEAASRSAAADLRFEKRLGQSTATAWTSGLPMSVRADWKCCAAPLKVSELLERAQTAGGEGVVVTQAGGEGRREAAPDVRRDERLGDGTLIDAAIERVGEARDLFGRGGIERDEREQGGQIDEVGTA
jgi:hypothetical protein